MPRRNKLVHNEMYRAELAVISDYYRNNPEKIAEFLGGENIAQDPTPIDAGDDNVYEEDDPDEE